MWAKKKKNHSKVILGIENIFKSEGKNTFLMTQESKALNLHRDSCGHSTGPVMCSDGASVKE